MCICFAQVPLSKVVEPIYTPISNVGKYSCSTASLAISFYRWETETQNEKQRGAESPTFPYADHELEVTGQSMQRKPVPNLLRELLKLPNTSLHPIFQLFIKKNTENHRGSGQVLGSKVRWQTRTMKNLNSSCSSRQWTHTTKQVITDCG